LVEQKGEIVHRKHSNYITSNGLVLKPFLWELLEIFSRC